MRSITVALSLLACLSAAVAEDAPNPRDAIPTVNFDAPFVLNKGADVEIMIVPCHEVLDIIHKIQPPYFVVGDIVYADGGTSGIIRLAGPWVPSGVVLIHEYEHLLEACLPDQRGRLRQVFHKLRTPAFDPASEDLEDDLPIEAAPGTTPTEPTTSDTPAAPTEPATQCVR